MIYSLWPDSLGGMNTTLCACGCGEPTKLRKGRYPQRFLYGHQARGKCNSRFGAHLSKAVKKRISETRQAQGSPWWKGRQHSKASLLKMSLKQQNVVTTPRKGKFLKCECCGKDYYRPKSRHISRFCSLFCKNGSQKTLLLGAGNPFYGKKHSRKTRSLLRESTLRQRARAVVLPTKPERIVHEALRLRGIDFTTEVKVGHWCVDVLIPARHLILFVDGCYWHACPIHFPNKKGNFRDAGRKPYLKKLGYDVEVVWEHELPKRLERIFRKWNL